MVGTWIPTCVSASCCSVATWHLNMRCVFALLFPLLLERDEDQPWLCAIGELPRVHSVPSDPTT